MIFQPTPSRGGVIGLTALTVLAIAEAALVASVMSRPAGPLSAVIGLVALALLPVLARVGLYVWGYYRLRYEVNRDGVIVHWAMSRQQIPMASIAKVRSGRPYEGRFRGVRWPGYEMGHARALLDDGAEIDVIVSATAAPPGQVLLLGSGGVAYGISPVEPAKFVEELRIRRKLGPVTQMPETTLRPRLFALPVWSDRATLRLLAASLVVNALLFAWIAWQFPALPATLSLRQVFDPVTGFVPAPARPRAALWSLPTLGLAAVALNALLAVATHDRARLGAILLAGGALMTQVLIAIAIAWAV